MKATYRPEDVKELILSDGTKMWRPKTARERLLETAKSEKEVDALETLANIIDKSI